MAEMVGLFSFRNERYKKLLERIQVFIVRMKKAEKQKRDEKLNADDPFEFVPGRSARPRGLRQGWQDRTGK